MTRRTIPAAGCILALSAACGHPADSAPRLAPSPAEHATRAAAAVPAPAADLHRARAALAARVGGWERPREPGPAVQAPRADAAALAASGSPDDLAAAAAALDAFLRGVRAPQGAPR